MDKLIFTPHYTGSFKYLEKLVPFLKNKYKIIFLFSPKGRKEYLPEMIQICRQKNYNYLIIPEYSPAKPFGQKILRKVPFYLPIRQALDFKNKVRAFLNDNSIKKIVSVFDTDIYNQLLFKEAQKKKIETLVLTWALLSEEPAKKKSKRKKLTPRRIYVLLSRAHLFLASIIINIIFELKLNQKITGLGNSQKLGVINSQAYSFLKKSGVRPNKMTIVGYIDFSLAEKTKQELDSNQRARQELTLKYQIDPHKINIAIYSTPFNIKDNRFFSDNRQLHYYKEIISVIRKIYNKEEADILFKIHPAEDINLYRSLAKNGVKLYNKDTNNFHLIYFASIYIAHYSTTNFVAMIMNKPAIFINFVKFDLIEATKEWFGIKKYITEYPEFSKLLLNFKNNKLDRQYHISEPMIPRNSIEKIIKWIN